VDGGSSEFAAPLRDVPIARRGTVAIFYVISWGFGSLMITFVGSLVLARLLTPRDFGLIAIGQTVAILAFTASEGGIASGFIRQSEGISRPVLRSINGVQLLISLALAAITTPIALQFGLAGDLTALIIWSLPIASLQTAGRVVLLRELRSGEIAIIEALGLLGYYVWAIAGVLAGHGVWSLASGTLVRAGIATATVGAIIGWGVIVPSLR
jgi:O-antigen/teichoic acid export membrane protein